MGWVTADEKDFDFDTVVVKSLTLYAKWKGSDGKDHMAVLGVALSINTKHKDYSALSASVTEKTSLIKDTIRSTVSTFTMEDMQDRQETVLKTILENLQKLFNSDMIVSVHFRSAIYQ